VDNPAKQALKFLHADSALHNVKLEGFRRLSTANLVSSLAPGRVAPAR
jgi:hypothetical protein